MFVKPRQSAKSLGTPFAGPSGKPWHVQPPSGIEGLIALTVTVFFRRNFGERYLNPKTILKGSLVLACYAAAMRFFAGGGLVNWGAPVPWWNWISWLIFSLLFFFYVSWQLLRAVSRRVMFRDEASFSDGRPREFLFRFMPLLRDEWDFERFYEPGICIGLGSLLLYFHNWFGLYLLTAGYCAYQVATLKQYIRRNLELNSLDARTAMITQPNFDEPAAEDAANSTSIQSFNDERREET